MLRGGLPMGPWVLSQHLRALSFLGRKENNMKLRDVRTTHERRAIPAAKEQGIRVRPARATALPSAWDDLPTGRRPRRSWKELGRKAQYQ